MQNTLRISPRLIAAGTASVLTSFLTHVEYPDHLRTHAMRSIDQAGVVGLKGYVNLDITQLG